MKILLASGSPRRRQLLEQLGYQVTVVKPSFDERQIRERDPALLVQKLAEGKGRSVRPADGSLLVAADTVVAFRGEILGKPANSAEAAEMLRRLSGNTHEVFTGVYLQKGDAVRCFYQKSEVLFRRLTEQEIQGYIATGSPLDKAGAYGIQDSGFVRCIQGSYHNVMGFPTERFEEIVQEL